MGVTRAQQTEVLLPTLPGIMKFRSRLIFGIPWPKEEKSKKILNKPSFD
jgi:hypothetical protein